MLKPFLLLLAFGSSIAAAATAELTTADIVQIKAICHGLAGADAAPAKSDAILQRLSPYVHDEMTLSGLHVVCDQRCGGLVQLRDHADIYFSYPVSDDAHSRIDTVVFHHRGKTILSIGSDGKR
jgi:hypothetical protein